MSGISQLEQSSSMVEFFTNVFVSNELSDLDWNCIAPYIMLYIITSQIWYRYYMNLILFGLYQHQTRYFCGIAQAKALGLSAGPSHIEHDKNRLDWKTAFSSEKSKWTRLIETGKWSTCNLVVFLRPMVVNISTRRWTGVLSGSYSICWTFCCQLLYPRETFLRVPIGERDKCFALCLLISLNCAGKFNLWHGIISVGNKAYCL